MSTSLGSQAESVAACFLQQKGYDIRAMNWRTRYCEIDIVAERNKCICFVEVKYRKQSVQGTGFDYITKSKLKRMRFAAELWVSENQWSGDYGLAAVEVSGSDFIVTGFESGFL